MNSRCQKYQRPLQPRLTYQALERLESYCQGFETQEFLGYPANAGYNYDAFFAWWSKSLMMKNHFNDVGNPLDGSAYVLNCRPFEREVIAYFADLFNLSPEEVWGYVTSGGTQGNEQALFVARERLKDQGRPVLYSSEESHHSIHTIARLLDLDTVVIHTTLDGEMDYSDLAHKLLPDRPAIFNLNIGSTFKGAIDDIETIHALVIEAEISAVHYHADAALFGGFLPFIEEDLLDFKRHPFDSIAVSGHKFFGAPIPLGMFLVRREAISSFESMYIDYIDTDDMTLPCSRSALATLLLWWTVVTVSKDQLAEEARSMLKRAESLRQKLEAIGIVAYLNPMSNTVYFEAPPDEIKERWALARTMDRRLGPIAHIVVMQHVTDEVIDGFVSELAEVLTHPASHL